MVNASSEEGRTAVNGMSYSGRSGKNANSAIIVSVTPEDFGSDHPLAGVEFQRKLEERAYELGGGRIPVQRYEDFCSCVEREREKGSENSGRPSPDNAAVIGSAAGDNATVEVNMLAQDGIDDADALCPQCKGGFVWADVSRILPQACNEAIVEGMTVFGRQIRGFDRPDALLSGVESRTSSPVRICRDESMQSRVRGLYPCGEGAGYAGGITSAAMDGLRVAEAIAAEYAPTARPASGTR